MVASIPYPALLVDVSWQTSSAVAKFEKETVGTTTARNINSAPTIVATREDVENLGEDVEAVKVQPTSDAEPKPLVHGPQTDAKPRKKDLQRRVIFCDNCHQPGHYARDCPEALRMTCRCCGQTGHFEKHCPELQHELYLYGGNEDCEQTDYSIIGDKNTTGSSAPNSSKNISAFLTRPPTTRPHNSSAVLRCSPGQRAHCGARHFLLFAPHKWLRKESTISKSAASKIKREQDQHDNTSPLSVLQEENLCVEAATGVKRKSLRPDVLARMIQQAFFTGHGKRRNVVFDIWAYEGYYRIKASDVKAMSEAWIAKFLTTAASSYFTENNGSENDQPPAISSKSNSKTKGATKMPPGAAALSSHHLQPLLSAARSRTVGGLRSVFRLEDAGRRKILFLDEEKKYPPLEEWLRREVVQPAASKSRAGGTEVGAIRNSTTAARSRKQVVSSTSGATTSQDEALIFAQDDSQTSADEGASANEGANRREEEELLSSDGCAKDHVLLLGDHEGIPLCPGFRNYEVMLHGLFNQDRAVDECNACSKANIEAIQGVRLSDVGLLGSSCIAITHYLLDTIVHTCEVTARN
ncbi:unnamed protein product [Amoebophrya sp. A120]|nr:unnamed protein product [Amoebophrya sp. A120]|eukprot:GSA120T00022846001.1